MSNSDQDITIKTGNSNTGSITITDGENGDISIIPDGEGQVNISKVDIDAGSIDGTPIGQDSTSSGSFTTLISSGNTCWRFHISW